MQPSPLILKDRQEKLLLPVFDKNDPIYVFDIGYHETPPAHAYGPAIRPYYLLHLIEKGKGKLERGGDVTELVAGEAFLIRPDEVTFYQADEIEPWTYSWISFYGSFSAELVKRTTNKLIMPYQKSGLLALKSALNRESGDSLECLHTLFEVLNAIKSEPSAKETTNDAIATALTYFENNYFRPIDMESFASQLGFSRAYFTTLFTKRTGETPYSYLIKTRIRKAKKYLTDSDRSVEEIAYSVGFSSLQRFSEMFKKATGISPLQYRKETSQR